MSAESGIGPHIPGYELTDRLGAGGQANVYKGLQVSMNRIVAIKVVNPTAGDQSTELGRFMREAQVLAKLRHENIVQAIDYGEYEGYRYLVMEFVEGESILDVINREGALSVPRATEVALHVCRALEHAEGFKVMHRDVKPANIVVTSEGRSMLVDFGLAKPGGGELQVTMAGMTVGTPHYMAPEQIRGEENLDIRVDIYALGGTYYHMLTGAVPFDRDAKAQILISHLRDPVKLPPGMEGKIPPEVFAIVKKAMKKDRNRRYQKAADMVKELEEVHAQLTGRAAVVLDPVRAAPTPTPKKTVSRRGGRAPVSSRERPSRATEGLKLKVAELQRKLETERRRVAELEDELGRSKALVDQLQQHTRSGEVARLKSEIESLRAQLGARAAPAPTDYEYEDDDDLGATDIRMPAVASRPAAPLPPPDDELAATDVRLPSMPAPTPKKPKAPDIRSTGKEAPMTYVSKGTFIAGENEGKDCETPRYEIHVPSFWVDVYPVTNRHYAQFVAETGRRPPQHWKGPTPPDDIADHPVVWITWKDAAAFAAWVGKRLPSLLEWQKAARGADGRHFPWGDERQIGLLNCKESGYGTTTRVDNYPGGVSPYGMLDAAGNVAEWVEGEFSIPGMKTTGQVVRAVCAGSWRDTIDRSRCASRRGYPDGGKAPFVGFRCARDS